MVQLLSPERVTIADTEPAQHIEDSVEAMPADDAAGGIASQTPTRTQDPLQSIRLGWRDLAGETAESIRRLSQATVGQALEIGQRLWRMQRDLKGKEYSTFLLVLGWASAKARKFINLAKTFSEFEPSQLMGVELTTLLSLCSKRYQAVVEQLREVQDITQQLVEQLIKEHRAPRIPKQEPISGWKRNRSGGGRRYEVHLHDESTGLSIEQQAEAEAILPHRVIQEAVALRLKSKTDREGDSAIEVLQVLEQPDEQEQINAMRQQIEAEAQQQARNRFEIVEFNLKQQIAYLEAQLAAIKSSEIVKPPTATGLQNVLAPEATLESSAFTVTDDAVAPESVEDVNATTVTDDAVAPELVESPTTITIPQDAVGQEPVESASQPQSSDSTATNCQILAADWDLLHQLRAAEGSLRKIDQKIQALNSKLAQSGSNVVERELKQLRSAKVSQLVELIDSSGLSAYYEEQQGFGRVVLDPKYASDFLMQSKSWAEVVLVVASDGKQLLRALKDWTRESRQLLVQLLSTNLEADPTALNEIDWIPKKLIAKALSTLPFRIRKIGGPNNLVDEPRIEYIPCSFVSLEYPGTAREQWVFQDSKNNNHPVFGRDEIEIERF